MHSCHAMLIIFLISNLLMLTMINAFFFANFFPHSKSVYDGFLFIFYFPFFFSCWISTNVGIGITLTSRMG